MAFYFLVLQDVGALLFEKKWVFLEGPRRGPLDWAVILVIPEISELGLHSHCSWLPNCLTVMSVVT